MDWLSSFVPVVAIVLVAWFGKAFVETKAISLALKQETQELLHQQQANAKELEHMKTELQLAYATTSRRRTDVETKCLTFLDEVKFVYRQSSLSTAPLPPHGRAEEDILKQAELVYQTYHQIHATFFGLVPYISPWHREIADAAVRCLVAALDIPPTFSQLFVALTPTISLAAEAVVA